MGLPLAARLQASGKYDVQVLTAIPWYPLGRRYPGYKLRLRQWELLENVKVLRVPLYPSHDASFIRRVLTYVSFALSAIFLGLPSLGSVDVVFYFDSLPTTGLVAFVLSLGRGASTVQHIGDLWPDTVLESGMLPRPLRWAVQSIVGKWCRFLYRRHSAITVASPGLAQLVLNRGATEDKTSVVYTWAFENRFFPRPPDRDAALEMGSTGKFTVLYAGNLGPLQALTTVIDAAALLRHRTDIQIVFIGTGQSENELRSLASRLQLDNIRFLGARPLELMNAFNATADALLVHLRDVPLMRNMTPSKTQVAMACARPILMGVAGDAAKVVKDANAGFTFEPENPRAMAAAILQLEALSVEERQRLGDAGRRFYEKNMSLEVGAARIASVLHDAGVQARNRRHPAVPRSE